MADNKKNQDNNLNTNRPGADSSEQTRKEATSEVGKNQGSRHEEVRDDKSGSTSENTRRD